jgi:hypothetical protein
VLVLDDLDALERNGARDRVTGPCKAVDEGGVVVLKGLGDAVRDNHGADGRVARTETLGAADDVRHVVVLFATEPGAQAPEGADDFVGHENHAVAIADLAHRLPVAGRWGEATAGVLDRLKEDRRDCFGALAQDGLFDLMGGPQTKGFEVIGVLFGPVEIDRRHLDCAGHQRFEGRAIGVERRDGQCPQGRAVVRDVATDDLVAIGVAAHLVVLARQFPGTLDGLGTTGGEKHPIEVARREAGNLFG